MNSSTNNTNMGTLNEATYTTNYLNQTDFNIGSFIYYLKDVSTGNIVYMNYYNRDILCPDSPVE